MSDDPEDPAEDQSYPDFSLVRPYIGPVADAPPPGQRSGRVLPDYDRPTELIRLAVVDSGPVADEAPRVIGSHAGPMSGRLRATMVIAAAIVLTGSAAGAYAISGLDDRPVNFGGGAPQVLPALVTSAPSPTPSVAASPSPSAGHGTKAAIDGTPPVPASSSSATAKIIVGTPVPTSTLQFGAQANLAAGRPVTCSGHSDVYVPSNAVDGDPNTYWESTNWQDSRRRRPQWLMVDLGQTETIGRIVLALPAQPAWVARTQTISILGSKSGGHFGTIVGTADYRFDPASGNTVTISVKSANTRYVQFMVSANTAWPAGQISEIEIFAA
jgi:hypothetical protein